MTEFDPTAGQWTRYDFARHRGLDGRHTPMNQAETLSMYRRVLDETIARAEKAEDARDTFVIRAAQLEKKLAKVISDRQDVEDERDEWKARAETAERERDAWRSEAESVRRMYEASRDRERALLEVVPDGPPDGHDVHARAGTVWLDGIDHTPDEAVDLARALLVAAEEARDGVDC